MVDLNVNFAGLELNNPICLAAQAPLGSWSPEMLAKAIKKFTEAGVALVKTGVVCDIPEPPKGLRPAARTIPIKSKYPFSYEGFFLICSWDAIFSYLNPTLKLLKLLKKDVKVPIGVNMVGRGTDEESWAKLATILEEAGADLLELNVSCPLSVAREGVTEAALKGEIIERPGTILGQNPGMTEKITKAVVQAVSIPVITKMTPEIGFPLLIDVASAIHRAGGKGVTVINAPVSVAPPDIYNKGRPIFPLVEEYSFGGAYGPWDRFITYKFIASIAIYVPELDIAAVGGNVDPEHAIEFIMLGAKTVEVSSAFIWRGYGIIKRALTFMQEYMETVGYEKLSDLRGLGLKYIVPAEKVRYIPAVAKIDHTKCTNCGRCTQTLCLATRVEDGVIKVDVPKQNERTIRTLFYLKNKQIGCNMVSDVTIVFEPEGKRIRTSLGATVYRVAKEAGVGIRSECGGTGTCGKCRVIIRNSNAVSRVTEAERKHLSRSEIDNGYRLACQTKILRNVTVMIPPESRLEHRKIQVLGLEKKVELNPSVKKFHLLLPKPTLSDIKPDLERLIGFLPQQTSSLEIDYEILKELPNTLRDANWNVTVTIWNNCRIVAVEPGDTSSDLFGFAIDIGTSKIVGHLVDLTSGKTVAIGSIENPQIIHGEDVMTRITFATTNNANLETLQKLVIDGINSVLHEVCEKARVNPSKVYEVVAVGNTAMHHFFLGIQPKYVALSPYTPALKRPISLVAKELNIKVNRGGILTILPLIAGFVGSDAVADILATGIHESEELSLLVDIGTNTEVFLGNKDDLLCCSCASGPAFEGAHIKHGMKAVTGAIERVRIDSDLEVEYETIGNVKPSGLCGSAVIDVVAEILENGVIDQHGRFNSNIKTKRIRKNNNETEFIVVWGNETATGKEITVTQKDIREIQLAKAAIYTGCSLLMKRKNLKERDIDRVFIAGAFGNYINPENAKVIGLIPDMPTKKIKFVGNTAVTGAKMALISKEIREKAELISKKVHYLELANDPDFNKEFIKALSLHAKIKTV